MTNHETSQYFRYGESTPELEQSAATAAVHVAGSAALRFSEKAEILSNPPKQEGALVTQLEFSHPVDELHTKSDSMLPAVEFSDR